ncbi:MAG: Membrane protein involved in the export of O-antigen and teichoic acid [uncultured bacterium]|nr:MAG: Membrane protein involved in the export of O-antigen and teichoic acid [uncultured bacterium]
MGYYKQALNGLSWMGLLRVVTRSLALVKIAILARILLPAQFGIYGIATLILGFLETLTETGINIFLIQQREKIDEYIDSAWVVSILRGIVIGIVIFIGSPFIATFFKTPEAIQILYLVSFVPVIRGFINPLCIKYQKNLEFNKQFKYDSVIFLVDAIFAITIGIVTKSENALVQAMLVSTTLEVILSFTYFKPIPKFVFEKEKTLKVINRGKWITGAGIANYLFQNLDDIVVGRILGTTSLGIYQQAYKISTLPVSEVGEVFNRVTFPIYVNLKDDKKRLRRAFLKTLLIISLLVIPCGLIVFKFPTQIIKFILGEKWLSATPVLQLLAIFGSLKAISNSFFSLFLGINKQEVVTYITLVSTICLIIILYPLIRIFGILGAGYATIIATLFSLPFLIFYYVKYFNSKQA